VITFALLAIILETARQQHVRVFPLVFFFLFFFFVVVIIIIVVRDGIQGVATADSVAIPLLCSAASLASPAFHLSYCLAVQVLTKKYTGFRVLGSEFSVPLTCACCLGAEGASEPTPACGTGCQCQGCGDPHRGCWGPAYATAVSMHSSKSVTSPPADCIALFLISGKNLSRSNKPAVVVC